MYSYPTSSTTFPRTLRCRLSCSHALLAAVLTAAIVMLGTPREADAFWFICTYRDANSAAEAANAARANYHDELVNPESNRTRVAAAKQAWDVLRKATFEKIKEFATEVPGTSLTGPPSVKQLTKTFIQEAIKETLGEISGNPNEGLPDVFATNVAPHGKFEGSPHFESIPATVSESDLSITTLKYFGPNDYDGSEGSPPTDWLSNPPMGIIAGTFTDVPVGDYSIDALNPDAAAFGGDVYRLAMLDTDLATPDMGDRGFDAGFFDQELVDALGSEDPAAAGMLIDNQLSFIEITSVDVLGGTISGNFFSVTGAMDPIPVVPDPLLPRWVLFVLVLLLLAAIFLVLRHRASPPGPP